MKAFEKWDKFRYLNDFSLFGKLKAEQNKYERKKTWKAALEWAAYCTAIELHPKLRDILEEELKDE